jgi:hypothetical protein
MSTSFWIHSVVFDLVVSFNMDADVDVNAGDAAEAGHSSAFKCRNVVSRKHTQSCV